MPLQVGSVVAGVVPSSRTETADPGPASSSQPPRPPPRPRPIRSTTGPSSSRGLAERILPAASTSSSAVTGGGDAKRGQLSKRQQQELEEANWASLERILDRIDRVPSARPPPYVRGNSGRSRSTAGSSAVGGGAGGGQGGQGSLSLLDQRHAWPRDGPSPAPSPLPALTPITAKASGSVVASGLGDHDGEESTVVGGLSSRLRSDPPTRPPAGPLPPIPQSSDEKRPRSARIESQGAIPRKLRVRGLSDASVWFGLGSSLSSRTSQPASSSSDRPAKAGSSSSGKEGMEALKLSRWRKSAGGGGRSPTVAFFDRERPSSVHSDLHIHIASSTTAGSSSDSRPSVDHSSQDLEALARSLGDLKSTSTGEKGKAKMLPRSASVGFGMHRAARDLRRKELARRSSERLPSVRDHHDQEPLRSMVVSDSEAPPPHRASLQVPLPALHQSSPVKTRRRPLTAPVVDLDAFEAPSPETFYDAEPGSTPENEDTSAIVDDDDEDVASPTPGYDADMVELASRMRRRPGRRSTVTEHDGAHRLTESRSMATLGPRRQPSMSDGDADDSISLGEEVRSRTTSSARTVSSGYHRVSLDVDEPSPAPSIIVGSSASVTDTSSKSDDFVDEDYVPVQSPAPSAVRRVESHITSAPKAPGPAFDETLPARQDVLGAAPAATHTSSIVAQPTFGNLLGDPNFDEQPDLTWTGEFWVYILPSGLSNGGRGILGRTPLIREVPGVRKKLVKRDSSHLLSSESRKSARSAVGSVPGDDSLDDSASYISDTTTVLGKHGEVTEERQSKGTPVGPEGSRGKRGQWKRVRGKIDEGYLVIHTESNVLIYRIYLPRLRRSDFRVTHPSVFGRPCCAGIHRDRTFWSSSSGRSANGATSAEPDKELYELLPDPPSEPIYVLMPTIAALQAWLVICRCYAIDETRVLYPKSHILNGSALTAAEREASAEKMRIWRAIDISILEGKNLTEAVDNPVGKGELMSGKEKRNSGGMVRRFDPTSSFNSIRTSSSEDQSARTASRPATDSRVAQLSSVASMSSTPLRPLTERDRDPLTGKIRSFFCEVIWARDMVARTAPKTTAAPFWSENFSLSDLGTLRQNALINVYQAHRNSKPTLIGTATVDIRNAQRNKGQRLWLPVVLQTNGVQYGELYVTFVVTEQVVMAGHEYSGLLKALNDDSDVDLPYNLATQASNDLEKLADLLLRIYAHEDRLLLRLCQIAALDIDGDATQAATLFRSNSLFTKMLEAFMRMVGQAWLDRSLGDVVRRICSAKVEVEIDPARLKSNGKEKAVQDNAKVLTQWASVIWQSIYESRAYCPVPLRQIFHKVQTFVAAAYEDTDMRITSISAFLFLRYFVPAILNPRLFGLTAHQPDVGPQRTLTLLAKTIQGLANLSIFGAKEGWMSSMNPYIREHTEAFRDYISFVSKPSDSKKPEWTSLDFETWKLPTALRAKLEPHSREGVPKVPHLLDVYRDLALLAHLVSKSARRERPGTATSARQVAQSPNFEAFVQECVRLDGRSVRRLAKMTAPAKETSVSANRTSTSARQTPPAPLPTPTTPTRRKPRSEVGESPLSPNQTTPTPHDVREAQRALEQRRRSQTVTSPARRPRNMLRQSFSSERLTSPDLGRLNFGLRSRPRPVHTRSSGAVTEVDQSVRVGDQNAGGSSVQPRPSGVTAPIFRHPFATSPTTATNPALPQDDEPLSSGYVSLMQTSGSVQLVPTEEPKSGSLLRMIRKNSRAASS